MLRPNWDPGRRGGGFRLRGCHPLGPLFPEGSPILSAATARSRNPGRQAVRFGLLRFRSPLLTLSRLISLPQGTEMFHFPWCGLGGLSSFTRRCRPAEGDGLSHSDTPGSRPVDGSPRFVAVFRVLLRLPMPRQPSCARIRLARNFFRQLANLVYVAILFNLQLPVFKDRVRPLPGRTRA